MLGISPGNIINIAGKSGSGKTTMIIYLVRSLLKLYGNNIAVCWYSMEDDAQKLMLNFISPYIKLTYDELRGKHDYTLTESERKMFMDVSKEFLSYDIEVYDKHAYMSHIKAHFQRFCTMRPNKFNILIIDNIMCLKDNDQFRFQSKQHESDDHIASQIKSINDNLKNDYSTNIWFLHHLTKEQLSRTNAVDGYRPREQNIRGSTRLRDVCTQGILIHRPAEFSDMVRLYKGTEYEEAIKYLIVNEIYKNRNGETGFFRYFGDLGYKIFMPF